MVNRKFVTKYSLDPYTFNISKKSYRNEQYYVWSKLHTCTHYYKSMGLGSWVGCPKIHLKGPNTCKINWKLGNLMVFSSKTVRSICNHFCIMMTLIIFISTSILGFSWDIYQCMYSTFCFYFCLLLKTWGNAYQ